MRLALVVPGGVDRSGTGRVIPVLLWLIERLARRHEVHVFPLAQEPEPSDYPLLGAAIHNLGLGRSTVPGGALIRAGRRLLAGLRRHGPFDLLHAFWANSPGFLAAIATRRLRIPLVVSLGGGEPVAIPDISYGSQLLLRERLKIRFTLRTAARVTVATRYMETLARPLSVEPEVVPLGVDGSCFAEPLPSERPRFRLLHVASLNAVKDQATLLRALRRVVDGRPEVHLDVVGEDTLNGAVQERASSLGLSPFVTFHGLIPYQSLLPFYRHADLLVLSSRHEAGPVVFLEAAACGVPTAGTAVGHVADLAPEAAVSVPVGDDVAFGKAIVDLLSDDARRRSIGQAARRWTLTHDADYTAAAFERIYREVTHAPGSR